MLWNIILIYLDICIINECIKDKSIASGILALILTVYLIYKNSNYIKQSQIIKLFKKQKTYTDGELIAKSIPIMSNDRKNIKLLFNIPASNEQVYSTLLEGFINELSIKRQQKLLYKLENYCKNNEKTNTTKVNIILKGINIYKEKNLNSL